MSSEVKLSSPDLAIYALKAMVKRRNALLGLCAPSLLIVVAAAVIGRVLFPADVEGELPAAVPLLMIASLAANVALVPAFTGWHRLLIQGDLDRGDGRGKALGWDGREWRYFRILIGIWLMMFVINIGANIVMTIIPNMVTFIFVFVATLGSYLAVWANLGLALPAAALGDGRKLRELLQLAEGNLAQIGLGIGGVWIVLLMLGVFGTMAAGAALLTFGSVYLVFVMGMLFYYIGLVGSVGVLSRAYDLLTRPDPQ